MERDPHTQRAQPMHCWCALITALFLIATKPCVADGPAADLDDAVIKHFERFCYQCHGQQVQKGDRRLDQITAKLSDNVESMALLEEALNAINRGEMPPTKKGVAQPTREETLQVVERITDFLQQSSDSQESSSTVLRRLNRFEYVNTLRDLVGIHPEFFDPTTDFPADAIEDGFDNLGETLTLSDYQLQRYLEVAEDAIASVMKFDQIQLQSQTWRYTGKDFNGVSSYVRAPVTWRLIIDNEGSDDDYMEIGHGQPSERHVNYVPKFEKKVGGVPADGWYTIKVRAAAANRIDHGYDHEEFTRFRDTPLKMALWIAPEAKLLDKNAADQRQLLQVWDLPDDHPKEFTKRVWLGKGAIPFVSWTNGISSKGNIRRVAEKHHPEVIRATTTQRDAAALGDADAKRLVDKLLQNESNRLLSDVYHGPCIRVWGMDIQGPTYEQWPPASHQLVFGKETDASKVDIETLVRRFAERAFRRPVDPSETEHYVAFIQQQIASGESHAEALKLGLAAILTSPRFLYLDEGNDESSVKLAQHELATRLSYFLWSSMPDQKLMSLASSGKLVGKALDVEVNRMLADDKSAAFVEHFTNSWLRLHQLGSMPPDSKAFGAYYEDRLEDFFKIETRLFFQDLLQNNGSILEFLDSDYTFANDALAKHYKIEGISGESFRKVLLRPEHHRGGLLGQGSVLTVTANGIETSPVVRGVWVLENIFGTPPPPPPPDVEPLEPDTRGTTTIRQQLAKHRSVTACADCHAKIDPAGFALEFYDPIGGYRTHYRVADGRRQGPEVDGSGTLPTSETFQDERELKKILLERKDRFAKALTEKLLTYATGRKMSFRDQAAIDNIAIACARKNYGLRDLILDVVRSDTFQAR